ncbi:MAG: Gfo/Idh/MocA family oxidoreductase [Lachnospiraceae bacterium]
MDKIRIGIVGVGSMGYMHLSNLVYRIPHAEALAVCARTESKVKAMQEEFDIPFGYTEYDAMLANPEIDAVVIATGAAAHKEQIIKACKAKKHIFTEKPLAKTLEETQEIETAVTDNADRKFMIGFMRRFDPSYAQAKQKIESGEIGRPILYKASGLDPASVLPAHLQGVKDKIYVPWFIEMGSHDADLARWFLQGEPVESYALGGAYVCEELAEYGDYDNGFSLTKFDNQTSAYIQVGRTHTCSSSSAEIVGTKGTITISTVPRKNFVGQYTPQGYVEECQDSFLERWGEAFYLEMKDFVECIRDDREPKTTVQDGIRGLKFALQLHEAYLKNHE